MQADVVCTQAAARWTQWMLAGDFEAAWRESDLIESTGFSDPHRFWTGESWAGKRVMLRCLHGLGDTVQFIRYAPLVRRTCSHLTVQSHPELVRLMRTVPGVDSAVTWEEGESWEMQMEITELPRAFRTTLSNIPQNIPYLQVASQRLPEKQFHVGLVWQSSQWNPARSIPFHELALLLREKGCCFHFLREEAESKQWDVLSTAEKMCQLDLIISVDTLSAHLAGALGKRVCILLPVCADWRWMKDRNDSPWYPTAQLFRQEAESDWTSVISSVLQVVQNLKNEKKTNR